MPENREIGKVSFHVFDPYEIHIQAFVDFINGRLMSGHSSSSTVHDFQLSSFLVIKNQQFLISKNQNGQLRFPTILNFSILSFPQKYFLYFPSGFLDFS